jgi:DNA-binding winged helix-turn-helix (wHTH) protein
MFQSINVEDPHYRPALLALPVAAPAVAPVPARDRTFRFGGCQVSRGRREITVDGEIRPLQPQPFDLLVYLIEHRERVVRLDELLDELWADECVQPGTVASTVARIRKVLADGSGTEVIRTYHRVGYRFVAPVILD